MTTHSAEQQRHQWLAALGIDSWLPRAALPAAAPSPDWVLQFRAGGASAQPRPAGVAVAPSVPPASVSRPAAPRIDTAALLGETPPVDARRQAERSPAERSPAERNLTERGPTERGPTEHGPETAVARARRPQPAPRFKLAFLLRGELLIVDSLPPHQPDGFSRQHRRLLQGITTALGIAGAQELSAASMLPWPMLAGKTLDQGAAEARKAVQRKLRNTLTFNPGVRALLLLGEAALHWVGGREDGLEALQGQWLTLDNDLPALASLSLSEQLRLPERKAEVWRDLQPLRRKLADG